MSLAVACDFILMADDAYLDASFTRLGLVPDGGITYHLPRRIGASRALDVLMAATAIPAPRAYEWGLSLATIPRDALIGRAEELAKRLAAAPCAMLRAARQLVQDSWSHSLDQQLREELTLQAVAFRGPEVRQGIESFAGKRGSTKRPAPRHE